MKAAVVILLMLTLLPLTSCHQQSPMEHYEDIQKAVERELRLYPNMTLIDLYKSFFQGRFGPGHLIHDRDAVMQYLNSELETAAEYDTLLWQRIGYEGKYFRLNLKLVKDGILPPEVYFNAFVESANSAEAPTLEAWKKEWNAIQDIIENIAPHVANFEANKQFLTEMLASGKVVIHHSEQYRQLYHPHYRVVDSQQFEKLARNYSIARMDD